MRLEYAPTALMELMCQSSGDRTDNCNNHDLPRGIRRIRLQFAGRKVRLLTLILVLMFSQVYSTGAVYLLLNNLGDTSCQLYRETAS